MRIYIIAALMAGSMMLNCDMFGTREPENPTGTSSLWIPPANPAGVLANIAEAFQVRDGILYMRSFARPGYSDSTFSFRPDYTSASYDSTIFSGWGYDSEQSFILMLFSPPFLPADSACSIEFIAESEPPGEFLPLYREQYILTIHHTNSNLPAEFSGNANIQFDRNHNGDWVIISWTDETSGESSGITELKSAISN